MTRSIWLSRVTALTRVSLGRWWISERKMENFDVKEAEWNRQGEAVDPNTQLKHMWWNSRGQSSWTVEETVNLKWKKRPDKNQRKGPIPVGETASWKVDLASKYTVQNQLAYPVKRCVRTKQDLNHSSWHHYWPAAVLNFFFDKKVLS